MKEELMKRKRWVMEKIEEAIENNEPMEVLQYWINIENSIGQRIVNLEVEEWTPSQENT